VVSNGIDTERFAPCAASRARFRERWSIRPGEKLVGVVGRLDPIKDHATFIRAARLLADRDGVRFACVGDGPEPWRLTLQRLVAEHQLTARFVWVPGDADMTDVYNGLDVLCSSSLSEGFPNVIGEAMSCGVPCVVTDVGDSARLVGRHGHVVPPGDAQRMADRVQVILDTPPAELTRMAAARRAWIARQFPVGDLLRASEQAIFSLLREPAP
jgi:glycosyltransferase involved in cell wall biosynthesis